MARRTSQSVDPIRVTGLLELRQSIEDMAEDSQKALKGVEEAAATLVQTRAKRRVPVGTGAARRSVKVVYFRDHPRVTSDLAYFSWLDWGGNNLRWLDGSGMKRVYKREGRYIYPAYAESKDELTVMLGDALLRLLTDNGLEED